MCHFMVASFYFDVFGICFLISDIINQDGHDEDTGALTCSKLALSTYFSNIFLYEYFSYVLWHQFHSL